MSSTKMRSMYYTMTSDDIDGVHVHLNQTYSNAYEQSTSRGRNPAMNDYHGNYTYSNGANHPTLAGVRKMVERGLVNRLVAHVMKVNPNYAGYGDKMVEDRVEAVPIAGGDVNAALDRVVLVLTGKGGSGVSEKSLVPLNDKGHLVPNAKLETPNIHWMYAPQFYGKVQFVKVDATGATFEDENGIKLGMSLEELTKVIKLMQKGKLTGTFAYVRLGEGFGLDFISSSEIVAAPQEWTEEEDKLETQGEGKLREWDS